MTKNVLHAVKIATVGRTATTDTTKEASQSRGSAAHAFDQSRCGRTRLTNRSAVVRAVRSHFDPHNQQSEVARERHERGDIQRRSRRSITRDWHDARRYSSGSDSTAVDATREVFLLNTHSREYSDRLERSRWHVPASSYAT